MARVRAELLSERHSADGSLPWTLAYLDRAEAQFAGRWRDIEITGAEALRIVVPPHAGEPCRGDTMALVPAIGATVADVAERLRTIDTEYARANPSCWSRITRAATMPFSTIIVTTAPLAVEEFVHVAPSQGTLFRLDGFHRLVGWAYANRLGPDVQITVRCAGP